MAEEADYEGDPEFPEEGELLLDERLHPDVLKADGVDEPARHLPEAGWWVALGGIQGEAFRHEGPKVPGVHDPHVFVPVAEGARGGHYRVLQVQGAYLDPKVYLH